MKDKTYYILAASSPLQKYAIVKIFSYTYKVWFKILKLNGPSTIWRVIFIITSWVGKIVFMCVKREEKHILLVLF